LPNIYSVIADTMMNSARPAEAIAKMDIDKAAWANTPGASILNAVGANGTFERLFTEFMTYGQRNANWQWDPGVAGVHKGKLLDGSVTRGECALFAMNLKVLAEAPKPYGLEMDTRQLEYWAFYGKHKQGFVADHDLTNMISRFGGNVRLPAQLQHPTGYYIWPNHKVIVYNGQVYDPSYGTVSPKRETLGIYQIKPSRVWDKKPEGAPDDWQPGHQDFRATIKLGNDEYVIAGDDQLNDVLFRKVPPEERPEQPFQGPYTLGEGDNLEPLQ
jgi:hypothetical protein